MFDSNLLLYNYAQSSRLVYYLCRKSIIFFVSTKMFFTLILKMGKYLLYTVKHFYTLLYTVLIIHLVHCSKKICFFKFEALSFGNLF